MKREKEFLIVRDHFKTPYNEVLEVFVQREHFKTSRVSFLSEERIWRTHRVVSCPKHSSFVQNGSNRQTILRHDRIPIIPLLSSTNQLNKSPIIEYILTTVCDPFQKEHKYPDQSKDTRFHTLLTSKPCQFIFIFIDSQIQCTLSLFPSPFPYVSLWHDHEQDASYLLDERWMIWNFWHWNIGFVISPQSFWILWWLQFEIAKKKEEIYRTTTQKYQSILFNLCKKHSFMLLDFLLWQLSLSLAL